MRNEISKTKKGGSKIEVVRRYLKSLSLMRCGLP